jgi:hypothetical protein
MKLDDSFERLSKRGPHRDPLAVISEARHDSIIPGGIDSNAEIIDLAAVHGVGWHRRVLALAAAVAVIAAGAAGIMLRNRTAPVVWSESTAVPSRPGPLTDAERTTALARCMTESNRRQPLRVSSEAAGVVDSRPGGLLVGLSDSKVWSTCFFPSDGTPPTQLAWIGATARAKPNALLPDVSPARPIVVVDDSGQKGTDGPDGSNAIEGNEVTGVWGRIDPSVASVIVTTHTARYAPTITDGLFAVWWRGNNSQETVVRGFDAAGNEVAFVDQLDCGTATSVDIDGVSYFPPSRRLVVNGNYVEGGCIGGERVRPGATADEIGDPK